jgi:uncharacterized protein YlxP (DUF503 family)
VTTVVAARRDNRCVHAAAVCFDLHVPESRSLKAKRAAIRPVVDGLRHLDQWQRSAIGVALVSGTSEHLHDVLDSVERFVDTAADVELVGVEISYLAEDVR